MAERRLRDETFLEIRYRPAYHSLIDPDLGYVEGSQIGFADTTLRYDRINGIELTDFTLIDVVSISPRDQFSPAFFQGANPPDPKRK